MKCAIFLVLLFNCAHSWAQLNYVINPGFESYTACPNKGDEINYATLWTSLDSGWSAPDWTHAPAYGVPEYCNICADPASGVGIPYGSAYHQLPHSGNGMAQVQMFVNTSVSTEQYMRDYLQGHLRHSLIKGQSYCVSFYVSLEHGSLNAVNHIGAYFDDGTIDTTHNYGKIQDQYIPQVQENTVVADTINWIKIEGSFIASNDERLITIGNFTDSLRTSFEYLIDTTGLIGNYGYGYTWYLVDDISVIPSGSKPNAGDDKVIMKSGDSVVIGDAADTYLPVLWSANGQIIDSNKANIKVSPKVTTQYIELLNLCGQITSDTVTVFVSNTEIRNENEQSLTFRISPNPNNGFFYIENESGNKDLYTIEVYDLLGNVIYSANELIYKKISIKIENYFSPGVYILRIKKDSNKCFQSKLIFQ